MTGSVDQGFHPIIIATKLDKLKRSQVQKQVKAIKTGTEAASGNYCDSRFSAETKQGRDEIWNLVDTEFLGKGTEE